MLKNIRQAFEDVVLWVQGFFLWFVLLFALQILLLVLWVGDCVKCFSATNSDIR
jgi:hypothetical protein